MSNKSKETDGRNREIIRNKKARFDYEIIEVFEAGMVLRGTEVKSLRQKKVSIQESYALVKSGEVFVTGLTISHYDMGNRFNHETDRDRKLLLHRHEIKRLIGKLKEKGYTLVPLSLYFKEGRVKMELGLAKGKAVYDKRKTIQKRDMDRELRRDIKRYT